MKLRHIIIAALLVTIGPRAMAQQAAGDTVLKGSTIEVIQSYKPVVKKAPKPEWMPQLPPADTTRPSLSFEVPQQTLYYSYTSGQLRPLALGKDSLKIPFPNYIKAGAGNLSTLFLDAGLGNIKGKNYSTGIHLHHLSQTGSIKGQQTASSGLEAEGLYYGKEKLWHAAVAAERNQNFFYGYNHDQFNYTTDSVKQTYTGVKIALDMKSKFMLKDNDIFYHPEINASLYDARYNTSETHLGFSAPFNYWFDSSLEAQVTLSAFLTHLKLDGNTISNNLGELKPGVILHQGKITGHGFIGFALGKDGKTSVLPDLLANYVVPGTPLTLSGGWEASIRKNTYEQLTTENPFLFNNYLVKQSRRDELFANVTGNYKSHLTYTIRASWWNFTNLATYINLAPDYKQFIVAYDDVSAFSLRGAVRYTESSKWSAGVSTEFYSFYQGSLPHVWHEPTFRFRGDVAVKPIEKLTIMGYASVLAGMNAMNVMSPSGNAIVLNPNIDLGVGAEYQLVSRLSAFAQGNNLLNSKYERWLGYEAYGLNVYGGVRLKF